MLIALRLAVAFALLAPAAVAGLLARPLPGLGLLVLAAVVAEGVARYVMHQRRTDRSSPASELVMIIAAIVVGLVGSWQAAAALPDAAPAPVAAPAE